MLIHVLEKCLIFVPLKSLKVLEFYLEFPVWTMAWHEPRPPAPWADALTTRLHGGGRSGDKTLIYITFTVISSEEAPYGVTSYAQTACSEHSTTMPVSQSTNQLWYVLQPKPRSIAVRIHTVRPPPMCQWYSYLVTCSQHPLWTLTISVSFHGPTLNCILDTRASTKYFTHTLLQQKSQIVNSALESRPQQARAVSWPQT